MIDYIIFGEFDINEGNVIKLEYPEKTGVKDMILSSYLIPEGAHNTMSDTFSFILNKKLDSDEKILKNLKDLNEKLLLHKIVYLELNNSPFFKNIANKSFNLKETYNYNSYNKTWELIKHNDSKEVKIKLKIEKDQKNFYNFVISNSNTNEIYCVIPIHSDIQFKKLNQKFASLYTLNSQAMGLNFESENDLDSLEKIFQNDSELISHKEDDFNTNPLSTIQEFLNDEKEIYFLCHLLTKLDKNNKRGATLKSIAIGTKKLVNLVVFKSLAKLLVDEAFRIHCLNGTNEEKLSQMKNLIEIYYKKFNSLDFPDKNFISYSTRGINSYIQSSNYFYLNQEIKNRELSVSNQKILVDTSISNDPEKIFPSDLVEFCKVFGEKTMIIYDGILSDKKIMFIGDSSTSCEKLSTFVFSCMSMVSPPCIGLIKRIFPYSNLYDLSFLERPNAIYAVTNPIFKSKTDWWDIMCEVDTGNVIMSESYKKQFYSIPKDSDNFFIKELIYKIKNHFLNEYEVSFYFRIYTSHILNVTGEEYFADDQELMNEINKQWQRKVKIQNSILWKIEKEVAKVKENLVFNGRSLKLINQHIDNIYRRRFIEREELLLIYNDIEKFLGNEQLINEFLHILVYFTIDFQVIFNGLFCKHQEIVKSVKNIYSKISETKFGSMILKRTNLVFLLRINNLEISNEQMKSEIN